MPVLFENRSMTRPPRALWALVPMALVMLALVLLPLTNYGAEYGSPPHSALKASCDPLYATFFTRGFAYQPYARGHPECRRWSLRAGNWVWAFWHKR
jgi:hypothetical protein